MRKISTGQDSTLGNWRQIAYALDGYKVGKATEFIDNRIKRSKDGTSTEVVFEEQTLAYMLYKLSHQAV